MPNKGMINIAGASDGRVAALIADILKERKGQSLIVVPSLARAKRMQIDLCFFSGMTEKEIYIMPPDDNGLVQFETRSDDYLPMRMKALKAASNGENCVIIAPVTSAVKKLPPKEMYSDRLIRLNRGEDIDMEEVRMKLSLLGYERVPMIEGRGEYSVRGGILDVFAPDADMPYRVELFDTEIDSIRSFDPDTQRSVDNLKDITIYPCTQVIRDEEIFAKASERISKAYEKQIKKLIQREGGETELTADLRHRKEQLLEYADNQINLRYMENFLNYFYDKTEYLWEYMTDPQIIIDDPARILEALDVFEKETADDMDVILSSGRGISDDFVSLSGKADFFRIYTFAEEKGNGGYIFTPFVSTIKNAPFLTELRQINSRQLPAYSGNMDMFRSDVQGYLSRGFEVNIVCSSEERLNNLKEFIEGYNISPMPSLIIGDITAGIEMTDDRRVWFRDEDIFGTGGRSRKGRSLRVGHKKQSRGQQIKSFADIQTGDYVVHENHGIGKFAGIEQLLVQGIKRDYLKVKYAGTDSLYIPVEQLGMLQKYIGGDGAVPNLNKLSGNEWKNTKARAKAAVTDMAQDLLELSAKRMSERGFAFSEDSPWQAEFEESFPHTETDEQLRCIEEIKADMEREIPMDRLLCGDVGFGKTEVAARALFKCVAEGKQAVVLVPTTLLANQHYYTLKDRFEKFPFKVEMLSRFRTKSQQKEIVKKLARGEIDLVIGTHRLLSSDIKLKDLGLLVVDEEQRFGVRHKEKIKQLRSNVDVLTLTATPIPRTLHMSLSGIKDMSILNEPPENRYPVQTYVMEQDDFVIREAIEKEIARDGQVFVLYNRVESINRIAADIRKLVPHATVAVGHGQMRESELEDIIMDFAAGEYNVLVSTTIIESGTDIPNVNTMVVYDADRFGLAQLYQLRGRVGRAARIAFAYLMHRRDRNLTEVAEKRLQAIRDFTEFGSGFKIAMKDLELRGAGNLLGAEQSGHMLNVGYELYCKLLDQAVLKLRGGENLGTDGEPMPSPDETVFALPVPAIIPVNYIDDEILRLQMYKKIAMVSSEDDQSDITDELTDRFGDLPVDTINLIRISKIRNMAGHLGVKEISQQGLKVKLSLWENVRMAEGVVPRIADVYGGRVKFFGGTGPYIRLTVAKEPGKPGYVRSVLKELELFLSVCYTESGNGNADEMKVN